MNPILPEFCYMPDAEARVMPDGRLYLYGSWDLPQKTDYCSRIMHCFSTDDMKTWVDHGVIFRNDEAFNGIPWNKDSDLYAPDAVYADGKYYLYLCGSKNEEGVAVADSPTGPFSAAEPIEIANGDSIDPTVLVDSDGKKYYFWGQFSLRGGELCDDMKTLKPETVKTNLLTEWEHGFHEGASIRRRGDKYYMVYTDISRGRATCLAYAVADHPLGPYQKGGVIVDNIYCDPDTWNNHGSIAEFKGRWYVFYHRTTHHRVSCRHVCAEPIEFDENGMIREVQQTSGGIEASLNAYEVIPARAACRMMANCYIAIADGREVLAVKPGGHWSVPDWAEYKYLDFGDGEASEFCITVKGTGSIVVKLENDREVCRFEFDQSDYKTISTVIPRIAGVHSVWLFLNGEFEARDFWLQ